MQLLDLFGDWPACLFPCEPIKAFHLERWKSHQKNQSASVFQSPAPATVAVLLSRRMPSNRTAWLSFADQQLGNFPQFCVSESSP